MRRIDSFPSCFFLLLKIKKSYFQSLFHSSLWCPFWLRKVRELRPFPSLAPFKTASDAQVFSNSSWKSYIYIHIYIYVNFRINCSSTENKVFQKAREIHFSPKQNLFETSSCSSCIDRRNFHNIKIVIGEIYGVLQCTYFFHLLWYILSFDYFAFFLKVDKNSKRFFSSWC